MTVSVLKTHYRKLPTKLLKQKKYKRFSNRSSSNSLNDVFLNRNPNEENGEIEFFLSTCSKFLKKHAPIKKCAYKAIR